MYRIKSENEILKYELIAHKVDNMILANICKLKTDIVDFESRLDLFRAKFSKANNELKEVKKREHNLKIELANKREKLKNAEDAFQRIVHE